MPIKKDITINQPEKKSIFLPTTTEKKEFRVKTEFKETINLNI